MNHQLDRRAERLITSLAMIDREQHLKRARVADLLEVSAATLAQWDTRGRGPKVTRLSPGCVRYRIGDLLDWLRERAEQSAKRKGRAGPGRGRKKIIQN